MPATVRVILMKRTLVLLLASLMVVASLILVCGTTDDRASRNLAPTIATPITDQVMDEDNASTGQGLIDLSLHFNDDNGTENLTYSISFEEEPTILFATITDTNVNFNQVLDDWYGTLEFEVMATDLGQDEAPGGGDDLNVTQRFNVTVNPTNDAPVISTTDITTATEDALYFNIYNGSDIDGDTLEWGVLGAPEWLTLTGTNLSGTPTGQDVGWSIIEITCSDGNGSIVNTTFNLTVAPTPDAPYFTSTVSNVELKEDAFKVINLTGMVMDEDGDDLSFMLEGHNQSLVTIDELDNGLFNISGKPNAYGTTEVQLWITDSSPESLQINTTFWINVTAVNDDPDEPRFTVTIVDADDLIPGNQNLTITCNASAATDIDGDMNFTYVWDMDGDGSPDMSAVDMRDIAHTYDAPGNYTINLTVEDGNAGSSWWSMMVTIEEPIIHSTDGGDGGTNGSVDGGDGWSDGGGDGAGGGAGGGEDGTSGGGPVGTDEGPEKSVFIPATLSIVPMTVAVGVVIAAVVVFIIIIIAVVIVARKKQAEVEAADHEEEEHQVEEALEEAPAVTDEPVEEGSEPEEQPEQELQPEGEDDPIESDDSSDLSDSYPQGPEEEQPLIDEQPVEEQAQEESEMGEEPEKKVTRTCPGCDGEVLYMEKEMAYYCSKCNMKVEEDH